MADMNTTAATIPKPSMNNQLLKPIEGFQRLSQTPSLSLSGDQTARRVTLPSVSPFIECDTKTTGNSDVDRGGLNVRFGACRNLGVPYRFWPVLISGNMGYGADEIELPVDSLNTASG